jgi:omega-6 fatty acid desaturase (delta-12 desaturase)
MTSLVILALTGVLIWLAGLEAFLVIQLPVTMISSSAGIWLFFVQHQFEEAYWVNDDNWDYTNAALSGSSFYKLPKVLQWFTGNIGFHHIHHLSPRIPNYMLEQCHKENPEFQNDAAVLTLRKSLKSILLGLWDENQKKLVSFRQYKRVYLKRASI